MTTYNIGRIGLRIRGDYNNTAEYEKLDVVYYGGSSYVAKFTVTGIAPDNGEYWQLLALGVPETFSSEEQFTGQYWVNGKPIYRRMLQVAVTANSTATSSSISGLDDVISITGSLICANHTTRPLNWWHSTNLFVEAYRYGGTDYIAVFSKGDTGTAYINVLYTKNT